MTHDSRVDDYIAKAQPFAQPILNHVRALVHEALPDAEEALKWGVPYFIVDGKNAVGMAAFKQHAALMVCSEGSAGAGMGNFGKLTCVEDLPSDSELKEQFRASAKAVQSPKTSKPKPKPKIPMPDDFAEALVAAKGAQKVWEAFTDAQRRDYLDWVTSAKREATRKKRIATAADWIGEGKRRNWKYESC